MGYDLIGKNSGHPQGDYFRANISGWSALRIAMQAAEAKAGVTAWTNKDWAAASFNNNKFVSKKSCMQMAKAMRYAYVKEPEDDAEMVLIMIAGNKLNLIDEIPGLMIEKKDNWTKEERDAWVSKYIFFLENCNGFNCW